MLRHNPWHVVKAAHERGFTLIEVVVVTAVLGIAAIAIAGVQASLFKSRSSVSQVQVRTRMVTECMEQVLVVQKQDGYDEINNPLRFGTGTTAYCDNVTAPTGISAAPTVSTTSYTNSTLAACPSGASCQLVTIAAGPSITLMLVKY